MTLDNLVKLHTKRVVLLQKIYERTIAAGEAPETVDRAILEILEAQIALEEVLIRRAACNSPGDSCSGSSA